MVFSLLGHLFKTGLVLSMLLLDSTLLFSLATIYLLLIREPEEQVTFCFEVLIAFKIALAAC